MEHFLPRSAWKRTFYFIAHIFFYFAHLISTLRTWIEKFYTTFQFTRYFQIIVQNSVQIFSICIHIRNLLLASTIYSTYFLIDIMLWFFYFHYFFNRHNVILLMFSSFFSRHNVMLPLFEKNIMIIIKKIISIELYEKNNMMMKICFSLLPELTLTPHWKKGISIFFFRTHFILLSSIKFY